MASRQNETPPYHQRSNVDSEAFEHPQAYKTPTAALQTSRQNPSITARQNFHNGPASSLSAATQSNGSGEDVRATIDPTEVFDPYRGEYEKMRQRQIEAEEARRKEAEEAESKAREVAEAEVKRKEAARRRSGTVPGPPNKSNEATPKSRKSRARKTGRQSVNPTSAATPTVNSQDNTLQSTQQIQSTTDPVPGNQNSANGSISNAQDGPDEAEVRMLLALREWKTKDPSRFSKLLGELTKDETGSTVQASTPTSVSNQPSVQQPVVQEIDTGQSVVPHNTHPISSRPPPIAGEIDGMLDVGKFPAMRRRRGGSYVKPPAKPHVPPGRPSEPYAAPEHFGTPTSYERDPSRGPRIPQYPPSDTPSTITHTLPVPAMPRGTPGVSGSPTLAPPRPSPDTPTPAMPTVQMSKPAPFTSQQSPPRSALSGQGTVWPEAKKAALVDVAFATLKAMPENKEKQFVAEDIMALLNENPSYIELCEKLEAKGIILHRGQFARSLLAAVPDLNSAAPTRANAAPSRTSEAKEGPSRVSAPPTSKAPMAVIAPPAAQTPSMVSSAPPFVPPTASSAFGISPEQQKELLSGRPTILSTPIKAGSGPMHVTLSRGPGQPETYGMLVPVNNGEQLPKASGSAKNKRVSFIEAEGQASTPGSRRTSLSRLSPNNINPSGRQGVLTKTVGTPGSKEAMARKRDFSEMVDLTELSDYEDGAPFPKQVRASVPPSTSVPIDPALQRRPLLSGPAPGLSVSQISPILPKSMASEESARRQQLKTNPRIARQLDRKTMFRRRHYDSPHLARDILIAAGRHDTEPALNSHMEPLKERFPVVDNGTDLSTFKWNLVDPGGPPPPDLDYLYPELYEEEDGFTTVTEDEQDTHSTPAKLGSDVGSRLDSTLAESDLDQSPRFQAVNQNNQKTPTRVVRSSKDSPSESMYSPPPVAGVKRRGRPPGAKNKGPRVDKGVKKGDRINQTQSSATPRRGRPPGPSKLRNAVSSENVAVSVSIPTKTSNRSEEYSIFKCGNLGCSAELHNLDTLKRHVEKVHGDPNEDGDYECLWKHKEIFGRKAEWANHIETQHLDPLAWKLGEGPNAASTGM